MDAETKERLIYDATLRQLERMRGMQYGYHQKFFHWIIISIFIFLTLLLLPNRVGYYLIPFFVVSAGVQSAFYLHFCDFARTHSRFLESKINELLGQQVLLGTALEELYFYPQSSKKVGGILLSAPSRFFNIYTLHWVVLWTGGFVASLFIVHKENSTPFFLIYTASAFLWAGLHLLYIGWYFGQQKDLKKVAAYLQENLQAPFRH